MLISAILKSKYIQIIVYVCIHSSVSSVKWITAAMSTVHQNRKNPRDRFHINANNLKVLPVHSLNVRINVWKISINPFKLMSIFSLPTIGLNHANHKSAGSKFENHRFVYIERRACNVSSRICKPQIIPHTVMVRKNFFGDLVVHIKFHSHKAKLILYKCQRLSMKNFQ